MENITKCEIHIIRIAEEQKENGAKEIFEEIMIENFPKVMTDIKPQFQKTH